MRYLLISPYVPHAAVGHGGGVATYQLAKTLARSHEVSMLCFRRHGEEGALADLRDRGVQMHSIRFRSERDQGLSRAFLAVDRAFVALRARREARPPFVEKYRRREFFDALARLIDEFQPDVVQVEYSAMACYARHARELLKDRPHTGSLTRPVVVLNTHEAGILPRRRRVEAAADEGERLRAERDLALWTAHERDALTSADLVQCVTEGDRQLLAELIDDAAHLKAVPLGIETESSPPADRRFPSPPRLLFVGSFDHGPNRIAAQLLVDSIMPLIWARQPEIQLDIIGRRPPASLTSSVAAESRIRVLGFVENLDHSFDAAWLFVAPLISGGGIKIKILDALARGAAVVTTDIGIEGINVTPGTHVLIAEGEKMFADACVIACEDAQGLRRMGDCAREHIVEKYSWEAIIKVLLGHIRDAAER